MDNNPMVASQTNPLPRIPQTKSNLGRNLVMIISAVLIVVILIATGYLLFLGSAKKIANKTQVYVQPTVAARPTVTPTPSTYQINTKDTSDSAIDKDTTAVNQNLGSLDSGLNAVDQSFNDQQTNLQ